MARKVCDALPGIKPWYVKFASEYREGYYWRVTREQWEKIARIKGVRASRIPATELAECVEWSNAGAETPPAPEPTSNGS